MEGRVTKVVLGTVMAEVTIRVGRNRIVAAITRGSAERMKLKEGDRVVAVFKATEVLVMK